jgi:Ca-activated chloride channel family protein
MNNFLRIAAAVALLLSRSAFADEGVPPKPALSETISVGYVMVPFVATDIDGRAVSNLRKQEVTLLVDGVPVKTDMFDRAFDAPVSYTILIDASGSMSLGAKMEGARMALGKLVGNRTNGDDYALYAFSEGQVRELVPFTEDPKKITRAVDAIEPWGRTAFFDALARMPDKTLLGKNGSRAIVLLTDGLDNASKMTRSQLILLLQGIDVPVYPIALRPAASAESGPKYSDSRLDMDILGELARASGGRSIIADLPSQLMEAISEVQKDLRSQYLVGFTPTGHGAVKYRRIAVRLTGPNRHVRVRAGYRGTAPPTLRGRVARK